MYLYNGIQPSHIYRSELLINITWMNSKIIILSERRSTEHIKHDSIYKKIQIRGTWVAQSVEHQTLDFGSGHDPRVKGSSPTSDSVLMWRLLKIFSFSFSLPPPPPRSHTLALKLKKKYKLIYSDKRHISVYLEGGKELERGITKGQRNL